MALGDILLLLGLLLTVVLSASFSGIETGIISLNRIALRQRKEKGDRRAIILTNLLRRPERLLAGILVGNNLVNVTAAIILLHILSTHIWSASRAEVLMPLVLTPLLLIFGEILPKTVFRHKADTLSPVFAPFLRTMMLIFSPLVGALLHATSRLNALLGSEEKGSPFITREDVRLLFAEGEEEGVIEEEERELIHGAIDFGITTVREIIVPRIDVVAIADNTPWEEACEVFEAHGHSRLPVYHEQIDKIEGIIYVFDLMRAGKPPKDNSIRQFIRPVTFIPESKKIQDLLHEFRQKQTFMGIVVDEYGGTAGLVTLEDLIEEIFGEIHDEYDVRDLPVTNLGEGLFVLDARMHKDEAEELLGVEMPEGEYETVGGFIFEQLGRIPKKGESFRHCDFQVTILETTERAITRVKFELNPTDGKRSSEKKR